MSLNSLPLEDFLRTEGAILDVRSPGEFEQGHLPGALNLPLFSNEERAKIGTIYKQICPEKAVEEGFKLVGPRLHAFILEAKQLCSPGLGARIHCWRGGMRSEFVANILRMAGLTAYTLKGGYKTFRRWTLSTLELPLSLKVVGGLTGSGKTEILKSLKELGEQTLDLEAFAGHRGSSFGILGKPPQISHEQFENALAFAIHHLDHTRPIWLEDESRNLGQCAIPNQLFFQMSNAPLFLVERPITERLAILREDYSHFPSEELCFATQKLKKRLGDVRTQEICSLFHDQKFDEAVTLLLSYYDPSYSYTLKKRSQLILRLQDEGLTNLEWAKKLKDDTKYH